ncbi:hypothetical protein [Kribbella sp. CA-293567]|uniref:hypothetical protein n=1 Tax=Kribbella sp. CA-293567 TaxID=3002436 RepID=UPI0022DE0865|nr:hypothetical protein [Kribbella sp. CA-293567]WBQ06915.1 hypothetical protein OX958_08975 [Kribbella sp. CA-293567]
MARVRLILSWVFVRGPATVYESAESRSSVASWIILGGMALSAALGAAGGSAFALATGRSTADTAWIGAGIGVGVVTAWLVMLIVVIGVLWVRGISPAAAAAGDVSPEGKHTAEFASGWRRTGEPLVPGSLIAFLACMIVCFGALAAQSWYTARAWDEPSAVTEGKVVGFIDPHWLSKGSGSVVVQYVVGGTEYEFKTGADLGERLLKVQATLPVEYAVERPEKARAVWAVEAARDDLGSLSIITGLFAVLEALAVVGYLVGKWRVSRR